MWVYKNERPHKSLMNLTPTAFLLKYGKLHHPHKDLAEFSTFQQGD
jgi:putative transposase